MNAFPKTKRPGNKKSLRLLLILLRVSCFLVISLSIAPALAVEWYPFPPDTFYNTRQAAQDACVSATPLMKDSLWAPGYYPVNQCFDGGSGFSRIYYICRFGPDVDSANCFILFGFGGSLISKFIVFYYPPNGCPPGEKFVGPAPGRCEAECPVKPLSEDYKNDACANSLEKGGGVDVDGVCPPLTEEMQRQAQCLADKIAALQIPYSGPTSTVRNAAYQNHLAEIWRKLEDIEQLDDKQEQACAQRKQEIEAEKAKHKIKYYAPPHDPHDTHSSGDAIDISNNTAYELSARVTTNSNDVQDYIQSSVNNPPACNLLWGGRFIRRDPIHFQYPR